VKSKGAGARADAARSRTGPRYCSLIGESAARPRIWTGRAASAKGRSSNPSLIRAIRAAPFRCESASRALDQEARRDTADRVRSGQGARIVRDHSARRTPLASKTERRPDELRADRPVRCQATVTRSKYDHRERPARRLNGDVRGAGLSPLHRFKRIRRLSRRSSARAAAMLQT